MKGEIRLRVVCLMPERLLVRAVEKGAKFHAVSRADARTLIVDADPVSARILLDLCRRFSVPARIVRRAGRSAFIARMKRRATLPVGMIVCIALCALFLSRIWFIDIAFTGDAAAQGNPALFTQWLSELGIRPGCMRDIDTEVVAQRLQIRAADCSFVGVGIQGVRLSLEAAPEQPAPQVYDVNAARDLICDRDGIVISANARSGMLCVAPGDTVRRGQLLIRGEELAAREDTRPIAALGEVMVRSWYDGESELPMLRTRTRYTGRVRTASRLRLLGREWMITPGVDFQSQRIMTEVLPIGGLFIPLEIIRENMFETQESQEQIASDVLKDQMTRLALADAARRLSLDGPKDYEILRVWTSIESTGGAAQRARAVYEIRTNAAVTREVLLQGG